MTLQMAAELIASASRGVALTGAGVSVESGIPAFRGQDGLWTKVDPVKVASIDYFLADPGAYWAVAKERGRAVMAATPNAGHTALARLEAAGHLSAVVTQNTDGLHQDSGSKRVIELHGSGRTVTCLDCGAGERRSEVQERLGSEMPPRCRQCGGARLKPAVVLFGEALPLEAMRQAIEFARDADVMLVVGSSLVVYPAAEIPIIAMRAGARLIVVNAEPTPLDAVADAVVRGQSGTILPELVRLVGA